MRRIGIIRQAFRIDSRSSTQASVARMTSIARKVMTNGMTARQAPNGSEAMRKKSTSGVSATSRMVSAISFGVFWRLAPSTIAIMRSRNVCPGSTVTFMTIQSDNTRVPPVTESGPAEMRALIGDFNQMMRELAQSEQLIAVGWLLGGRNSQPAIIRIERFRHVPSRED